MRKSDNEVNNYDINNPDGLSFKSTENKIEYINDNNNFTFENNVKKVQENEYVNETYEYSKNKEYKKKGFNFNNSLLAVSSALASSVVAVASVVIIGVFLLTNSIIDVSVFVCSSNSITFYIQANVNKEEFLIAKLYNDQMSMDTELFNEPFITFYDLEPDTEYTLTIFNMKDENELYNATFKTANIDCVVPEFMDSWVEEDGTLCFGVFVENYKQDNEDENVLIGDNNTNARIQPIGFYTVLVLDKFGKQLYAKDETEREKDFEFNINNEEMVYICAKYNKEGFSIGNLQIVYNYSYQDNNLGN